MHKIMSLVYNKALLGIVYIGKLKQLLFVRVIPLGVRIPSFPQIINKSCAYGENQIK